MSDHQAPLQADQEENLKRYFAASEPSQEFAQRLGAELYHHHVKALQPRQPQESWMTKLRSALYPRKLFSLRTFEIVLAGLLLISGTVYALGLSLGYIPGFGMVQSGDPIRTISGPLSQTREGVTLTVKQVLLASDKTSISISVSGLAPDALSDYTDSLAEQRKQCSSPPEIQQGAQKYSGLKVGVGEYDQDNHYVETFSYPAISKEISSATLVIPCILNTRSGKAPENWVFPLVFVPASSQMAVLPVIQVATPFAEQTAITPNAAAPMVLENVIETSSGYIFTGSFRPFLAASGVLGVTNSDLSITGADGTALVWRSAEELIPPSTVDDGIFHWAYRVNEKNIVWPITIRFRTLDVFCANGSTKNFQWDVGTDPQPGQSWNVGQNIQIGGCMLSIRSIKRTTEGYAFILDKPEGITSLSASIETPGWPVAGSSQREFPGYLDYSLIYEGEIPGGLIQFTISSISESISGNWAVQWQPDP